jgi:uncharacterized membrane protein YkgB
MPWRQIIAAEAANSKRPSPGAYKTSARHEHVIVHLENSHHRQGTGMQTERVFHHEHWLPTVAGIFGATQIWLGLSSLFSPAARPVATLLEVGSPLAIWLALAQVVAGFTIAQGWFPRIRAIAAGLTAATYFLSLAALFHASAWEADFGGFPAIGEGQRFIKHFAMGALAGWIAATVGGRREVADTCLAAARFGVIAVMLWIGAAKFTSYEAEGIQRLLDSNIVVGWLYLVFDVRGASDFIGTVEILAGLAMLGWPYRARTGGIGLLAGVGTFIVTLSFIFTLPGWASDAGAPWLSASGAFFLKDLLLLLICAMSVFLEGRNAPQRYGADALRALGSGIHSKG